MNRKQFNLWSNCILWSAKGIWLIDWLIELGFNDTSTLVGHFVSSPRERVKKDRRDSRGDEREGQGRKRNKNESEETEDIKTSPSTLTCYKDSRPCLSQRYSLPLKAGLFYFKSKEIFLLKADPFSVRLELYSYKQEDTEVYKGPKIIKFIQSDPSH